MKTSVGNSNSSQTRRTQFSKHAYDLTLRLNPMIAIVDGSIAVRRAYNRVKCVRQRKEVVTGGHNASRHGPEFQQEKVGILETEYKNAFQFPIYSLRFLRMSYDDQNDDVTIITAVKITDDDESDKSFNTKTDFCENVGTLDANHMILIPNIAALSLAEQESTPIPYLQSPISEDDGKNLLRKTFAVFELDETICSIIFYSLSPEGLRKEQNMHVFWKDKVSVFVGALEIMNRKCEKFYELASSSFLLDLFVAVCKRFEY
ncbi:hypothetical protein L1987_75196 [Smallanthus sonchifolius]|uniref:Uncharacterized protein n=1 Tax=Smallanthus sonchifolius TaxID=185202 RepID=A0ACB9A613_9ASTR|nr:hypothetical protein L1987_75196 [Smallanthus sonchifolius]